MGFYEESLNHYIEADLQSLTEKALPCRSLRIVAESYAIKGKPAIKGYILYWYNFKLIHFYILNVQELLW